MSIEKMSLERNDVIGDAVIEIEAIVDSIRRTGDVNPLELATVLGLIGLSFVEIKKVLGE